MGVAKGRSLKTLLIDLKNWFALKADTVFSVNKTMPVDGDVTIKEVDLAVNLSSDKTQQSAGEFIIRTSGGDASIEDGDAFVLKVMGNRVHTGYVAEELNMTVIPITRPVPASITASLDETTFISYVEEAGTYSVTYDDGWDTSPTLYGITVSGTPLDGDNITIVWDGENDPEMTVVAPRTAPPEITATIDRDTFVEYVTQSGTITLTYTTAWSADPEDYGITVENEPVGGDQIVVVYVKEDRGTITQANPTSMKSTGWNLYDHALGYAVVTKYSETYGFRIGGTYSSIAFSATQSGTPETITPVDGMFSVPSDGFVFVTGGNSTDTYIINAWSDWTEGYVGEFKAYEESTVDLSSVMSSYFPYGLMRVGDVRDEINLNISAAISRIGRMEYTPENLASAEASGRAYEADTNYIYIVKAIEDVNAIAVDGSYTVNDHGNEIFYGSNVPVYLETLYGNNLKNKLERDVVQISQQTLTSAQQAQVRTNIGAFSQSDGNTLNGRFRQISSGSLHDIKEPGIYWLYSEVTDKPNAGAGTYILNRLSNDYLSGIYVVADDAKIYSVKFGGTWKYEELMFNSTFSNFRYRSLTNVDLDSLYGTENAGFYYLGTGNTHSPGSYSSLIVISGSDASYQLSVTADNRIKYRKRVGSPPSWSAWVDLGTYDTGTITKNASEITDANFNLTTEIVSGTLLIVSGYIYVATAIANNTKIATVSIAPKTEVFQSIVSSNGKTGRFKFTANGEIFCESALEANSGYYSMTFVSNYV